MKDKNHGILKSKFRIMCELFPVHKKSNEDCIPLFVQLFIFANRVKISGLV